MMLKKNGFQSLVRFKSSSAALEKIREKLEKGPTFQEFVQNPTHNKTDYEFDGKLKKEKNEKTRLRLPPWLKTTIPIGNEFSVNQSLILIKI